MDVQDYDDKISKELRMGSVMRRDDDDKDSQEHYEICVFEGEAFDEVHVASPESTEEFFEDAIDVALDSGAGEHVAGRSIAPTYAVEESAGSRAGQHFGSWRHTHS